MTLQQEQTQFDKMKWQASVEAGKDTCGSYDFCALCNKKLTYPCARAARRFRGGVIRVASITLKK